VLFVKVDNGGVFFFVKKVDLSSTQGALCIVSVFFISHFTYWGCTHPTHPPVYGPGSGAKPRNHLTRLLEVMMVETCTVMGTTVVPR